ncbi:MAG: exodeoxyribonuclease VII small subunit [Oscillospiraceae bacterium]|nr:exodeoxyribonuclease VII small subunit [Oscillospiraceae bacterium]
MDTPTFEKSMARLEEIVALLERGDTPLEEALKLFEEGSALIRTCENMLENAEQVIVKLVKGPDGEPEEAVFLDEDR